MKNLFTKTLFTSTSSRAGYKRLIVATTGLFFLSFTLSAQTIIGTVAGNDTLGAGYSGDGGKATSAELHTPNGVAIGSAHTMYIADLNNNIVRKVTKAGIITTVAGNNSYAAGYGGDGGPATAAELNGPSGIAVDASGNLYIADKGNNIIRKVNTSGIISTYAGIPHNGGYSGNGGPATAAELASPNGVAVDASGNLYIADYNNYVIRKVSPSGTITTYAGDNNLGYSGDGGAATAAEMAYPWGVGCDNSGNVYVADNNNNVIRKVSSSGTITTCAGNNKLGHGYSGDGGAATAAQLNHPSGVCFGNGNIFISDAGNEVIRMVKTGDSNNIVTVAGNNAFGGGYSGDGGPATAAELNSPSGVAYDTAGYATVLYISDADNQVVRKLSGLTTGVSSVSAEHAQITVYPNPSNGIFTIAMKNTSLKVNTVEVYNILGEKVYTSSPQNPNGAINTINLSSQPNGIYLYRIVADGGNIIGEGKLAVQR